MGFRTLVITSRCKLSYKNDHLYIRGDELTTVHLSELETIIVDTTQAIVTSYLLCELMKRKISIIFCDEVHNPQSQLIELYGSHNTSKRIRQQVSWNETIKEQVWTGIVNDKIRKQSQLLERLELKEHKLLKEYINDILPGDTTNREGHAAKVYFNALFGKKFTRDNCCSENKALNYGYAIILSFINREIVAGGYLTQLGINHKSEFNPFNLTCDFMEPYRILIDRIVYENRGREFDSSYKLDLVDVLNHSVVIDNKNQYVSHALKIYIKSLLEALETGNEKKIRYYDLI